MLLTALYLALSSPALADSPGYFRFPDVHGDTVVFTAEGDLWKVDAAGGAAVRLTTHPGPERFAVFSPDGTEVAFSGNYEGVEEVYRMPIDGGAPSRLTWGPSSARPRDWTADGVTYATMGYSEFPASQLLIATEGDHHTRVPLYQADDGVWDEKTLYFTRQAFQGSHTKRYQGGTAQNLWRFTAGDAEATPLTADYAGTSKDPMFWEGRVYFASDRDGVMNLWSMLPDGSDVRAHTAHADIGIASPALHDGRVVYQRGADLWLHNLKTNEGAIIPIQLTSDFDQLREHWVADPMAALSEAHLSPDGDRVVLTARGQVFVAPVDSGRFVTATRDAGVRYLEADFLDKDTLIALSDESGELEFWTLPANGQGTPEQLTDDGRVQRLDPVLSPDGAKLAYTDKNARLWVLDTKTGRSTEIETTRQWQAVHLTWSPDSAWLAYTDDASNGYSQVWMVRLTDGLRVPVTSDRFYSSSPSFSPDGKWLYFLTERSVHTMVGAPWGPWQPEPYVDQTTQIYAVSLQEGTHSPWVKRNELQAPEPSEDAGEEEKSKKKKKKGNNDDAQAVAVDVEGLAHRLFEIPVPAQNMDGLEVFEDKLLWQQTDRGYEGKTSLMGCAITEDPPEVKALMGDIQGVRLSRDRKRMLVAQENALFTFDVSLSLPDDRSKAQLDTSGWRVSVDPKEEWRQLLVDAWRLQRDYFYDRGMHGNDWPAVRDRYLALVDRVTDRAELDDVISQMVGELSALHVFVFGGDHRSGKDTVGVAALGGRFERVPNGYRVAHVYQTDPEWPTLRSPLARPEVDVKAGDVLTAVDGVDLATTPLGATLRHKMGRPVRLTVQSGGKIRDVIVRPMDGNAAFDLRYREWEYTRRLAVEDQGQGDIGYLHLRNMGGRDYDTWMREYYPVFQRQGLIIDVRNNGGGNIDSWILEKLLRKAWMYWKGRNGDPAWNMQYAFLGHVVVLCDENTMSDGEAFSEGFRRLGLGKVIGTRTWGGEIWLDFGDWLKDGGMASVPETGVYGNEGEWLIEGHGVEPDIVVDNLPHATFNGVDAQLDAAIGHLMEKIAAEPVVIPDVPAYPDKSIEAFRKRQRAD